MQPETYEKVLNEANYVLDTMDNTDIKSDLYLFHDEIVSYIRENYSSFDGSPEQLREIMDFDELIERLWRVMRVIHPTKFYDDSVGYERFSVYRGAAPLLMGLFKEATGLKYESWYFINTPLICQNLLKVVVADAIKRGTFPFGTFARHLLFKLLAHKPYRNVWEKKLTNYLAPIRAQIDNYLSGKKDLIFYTGCPRYEPSGKNTTEPKNILDAKAYNGIETLSESLRKELYKTTDKTLKAPHKDLCRMMLQYCSTSYNHTHYKLTINNPLDFDRQLPDLRSY